MLVYTCIHICASTYKYIYIQMKNKLLSLQKYITLAKCTLIRTIINFTSKTYVPIFSIFTRQIFLFPYVFPPVTITKWRKINEYFHNQYQKIKINPLTFTSQQNLKTQFHSTRKKHGSYNTN